MVGERCLAGETGVARHAAAGSWRRRQAERGSCGRTESDSRRSSGSVPLAESPPRGHQPASVKWSCAQVIHDFAVRHARESTTIVISWWEEDRHVADIGVVPREGCGSGGDKPRSRKFHRASPDQGAPGSRPSRPMLTCGS